MTCPESITREGETRGCLRTGRHRFHYTGFPSEYQNRRGTHVEVDIYTWNNPS